MDIKVFKKQGIISVDGTPTDAFFEVEVINLENLEQLRNYLTIIPLEIIKTLRIANIYTPLEYAIQ